ncbi:MAG: plasmid pRiA4b ORF-3 family protein [Acidobacteria bacterium]|nr:plasmid pRiA4b ORF-3 family protein [Acidobacteriota bacterium]
MPATLFKRLILRLVLRDVYPMVVRLIAVPDRLELSDFDEILHAVLGWDGGIGFAIQIQGQVYDSFQRKTRSTKLSGFRARAVQSETSQRAFGQAVAVPEVRMKFRLEVVCLDDGGQQQRTEVLAIERRQLTMETLGLSLSESKAMLETCRVPRTWSDGGAARTARAAMAPRAAARSK